MTRPDEPLASPSWPQRTRELRLAWDVIANTASSPKLLTAPRGDGSMVVLVPGFGTDDRVLWPLRIWLGGLGYNARSASIGLVNARIGLLVERLVERLDKLVPKGEPTALVGWSLGGVIAREAARDRPELVRRIITFGSPVNGGPRFSAAAGLFTRDRLDQIDALITLRNRIPLTMPVTAIWSPNDGIVPAAACIDDITPGVEHVEVSATHAGLGFSPEVWRIIADRLALDHHD